MIIQAFQSLHSHGFLKIQSGVDVSGLPLPTSVKESGKHAPLARAIVNSSLSDWFTIDNNPGGNLQIGVDNPRRRQGTRSFMPASADCFSLFQQIEGALKDCGLANSHHNINLSRGASWVRSKSISGSGLTQQTEHFDYDTTKVSHDRLQLPFSIFVYFQETSLVIGGSEQKFAAGDILIFLGDCPHAGSAWKNEKANYRLFCFLPTNRCLPSWESGYKNFLTNTWQYYPKTVEIEDRDAKELCDQTDPSSAGFNLDTYNAYAYCCVLGKFFAFNVQSWYNGLQTICYSGQSIYSSDAPQNGMFSEEHGVCCHWPSRGALIKAGLTEKSKACGSTFLDLRSTDCPTSSCTAQKRSRSVSSSSSNSLTPGKTHKLMHTHTHTHTHVSADGIPTTTQTVITQEIESSSSTSKSSSTSTSYAAQ